MGASQSSKFHCNRYLNRQGPPSLAQQANKGMDSISRGLNACQPVGQMTWEVLSRALPSFPKDNTLQLNYIFPNGIQSEKHPHPGQSYAGMQMCAYLPDNQDGRQLLKLLEKAFNKQLLFTVATSENGEDTVTAALIPLKTAEPHTDSGYDDYPDSDYLKTVRNLLKDKGIK